MTTNSSLILTLEGHRQENALVVFRAFNMYNRREIGTNKNASNTICFDLEVGTNEHLLKQVTAFRHNNQVPSLKFVQ